MKIRTVTVCAAAALAVLVGSDSQARPSSRGDDARKATRPKAPSRKASRGAVTVPRFDGKRILPKQGRQLPKGVRARPKKTTIVPRGRVPATTNVHSISANTIRSSTGKFYATMAVSGLLAPGSLKINDAAGDRLNLHFDGAAGKSAIVKCYVNLKKDTTFDLEYPGGGKTIKVSDLPAGHPETLTFALPSEKFSASPSGVQIEATGKSPWFWYSCTLTEK